MGDLHEFFKQDRFASSVGIELLDASTAKRT